jgi:GT2 family glycosyltransferase
MLIGGNNDVHEARAERSGSFTLGANCVIRRSLFESLGGFAPVFQRFNETVLYHRALDAGARIAAIDAILCTHHNDAGLRRLVRLLVATGHAKARYYASLREAGRPQRTRHPVYRWLGSAVASTIAALPLRVAGPLTIVLATGLVRRAPRLAAGLYRTGVGLTDVSGYCAERAWWSRGPGSTLTYRNAVASADSLQPVAVPPTAIELERTA